MTNDKTTTKVVEPVVAKPPRPYSPPARTKGSEEDSDPYLDKILAQNERSNITNDFRPPRQGQRRFMLSRVEPEVMPPPEEIGLIPPEEAKKLREEEEAKKSREEVKKK